MPEHTHDTHNNNTFKKNWLLWHHAMTQASAASYQFITHDILFGINLGLNIQKSYTVPIFYAPTFRCAMHSLRSWTVNLQATSSSPVTNSSVTVTYPET